MAVVVEASSLVPDFQGRMSNGSQLGDVMVGKEGYSSKEKGQVRFREGLRKQVVCVCVCVSRGALGGWWWNIRRKIKS